VFYRRFILLDGSGAYGDYDYQGRLFGIGKEFNSF